jgi:hypothetical protein
VLGLPFDPDGSPEEDPGLESLELGEAFGLVELWAGGVTEPFECVGEVGCPVTVGTVGLY